MEFNKLRRNTFCVAPAGIRTGLIDADFSLGKAIIISAFWFRIEIRRFPGNGVHSERVLAKEKL